MNHPENMATDAVIVEITALKDEIKSKSRRLHELATSVYRKARRSPTDATTAIYLTYANSVTRFAGMVEQAVVRTDRAARVLTRLPPEENYPKKEEKLPRPEKPSISPMESLISSYMEEGSEFSSGNNDDGES